MRTTYKYLLGLALPLMLFSCAENDLGSMDATMLSEGRAQVTIDVGAPGAFSASALSRSISVSNEDALDGRFVVFAFDGEEDASNLLFIVRTGDTNTNSNLNDASTSTYGDYSGSPSIAWHPADELSDKGRLYIEDDENDQTMELLILANVDPATTLNLTSETPTRAEVIEALSAFDYDVTDPDLTSIPMAGEFELVNGITLGSTGAVQLRRSVAKVTVRVEYDEDNLNQFFLPNYVKMLNINRTTATVYSPSSDEPNFPSGEVTFNQYDPDDVDPIYFPDEWSAGYDDEGSSVMYKEVVFYVAENENMKGEACVDGDSQTLNTTDPRISLLVEGEFDDYDGDTMDECWYRMDLLPATAVDKDDELDYILRNHHYRFVIHDMQSRGSTVDLAALALAVPDNYPFSDSSSSYIVVDDDDIVSITVERYNSSGEDEPFYVGVSSTSVDVPRTQDACFRVVIVTNCPSWTIDPSDIPRYDADNSAFDFVYETSIGKQAMWVWLDYPSIVREGESYAYYIVAGRIRKKMRINIVEGTYDGPDDDPLGQGEDVEPGDEP